MTHKIKKSASTSRNSRLDRAWILNSKTAFSVVEEYKAIRTNLIFSIPEEGCKVIGITSANEHEGKTISCLNLAITFAETGARVLLIDCDLRLPRLSFLVEKKAVPGISNILVGLSTPDITIQNTKYDGLDVILSGNIPPNPSELLSSPRMGKLLEILKNHYDYILIDTPPVNVVSDTVALSRFLSGVALVVRAGTTDKESVKQAIEKLEFANARVLGFILNDLRRDKSKFHKSYYSEYERNSRRSGAHTVKEPSPGSHNTEPRS